MKRVLHKLVALSLTVAMALTMVISGFAAEPAAVTKIGLPGTLTVGVEESIDVYLDVTPFHATPGEITWTSGSTETFTVEKVDGSNTHVRITGVKATEEGSPVELTAKLSDGIKATCNVSVIDPDNTVHGVWIAPRDVSLDLAGSHTFRATVSKTGTADATVSWSISGQAGLGTKMENGKLTIDPKESATEIQVTATVGEKSDTVTVKVIQPVISDLTIGTEDATTVQPGGSVTFTGNLTYTGNLPADDQKIAWKVEGKDGLSVDSDTTISEEGVLTIGASQVPGTLTVTGTSSGNYCDQAFTDTIDITVEAKQQAPTYDISVSPEQITLTSQKTGYQENPSAKLTISNTGNQATGKLTLSLDGTHKDNFTLSASSIDNLEVDGSTDITLSANGGLAANTYTATLTISGGNGISKEIPVSFTVSDDTTDDTTYTATLTPEEDVTFPEMTPGYTAPSQEFVLTNIGSGALSNLKAELSGTDKDSFEIKDFTGGSLPSGSDSKMTFTVAPKAELGVGSYSATLTVTGDNGISLVRKLSFTVKEPSTAGITLTPGGKHDFGTLETGYTISPLEVKIQNTGNTEIKNLTVRLSGDQASQFTVTQPKDKTLAKDGATTFTVAPAANLPTGNYKATVNVTADGDISQSFEVVFKVIDKLPDYQLTLDPSGNYTFPEASIGYGISSQYQHVVKVMNTGKNSVTNLKVTLSGGDANKFSIYQPTSMLGSGKETSFILAPIRGLTPGTYTAKVDFTASNQISHTFQISFTVKQGTNNYEIQFDPADNYTFPSAHEGYTTAPIHSFVVRNVGNLATGPLTVVLSGNHAKDFSILSGTSIPSIQPGGEVTIRVQPNRNLKQGNYNDVAIRVTGGNNLIATKNLIFTVTPVLAVSVNPTSLDFGLALTGYNTISKTITVKNLSSVDLTGVTVGFANSNSPFQCSGSTGSIPKNGSITLTVSPKTGLSSGSHTDTLIIRSGDATYQIPLSFKVSHFSSTLPTITNRKMGATLTIPNADYAFDFNYGNGSSVWVDGIRLSESQYTHQAGSVIIYLKPQYLSTLQNGDHLVEVRMANGKVVYNTLTLKSSNGGWHITYPNYDNDNEHWAKPPQKPGPQPNPPKPNPGTGGI